MSQNGPYPGPSQQPPGRDPDEPYTEPADPWSGQAAAWPAEPTAPAATPGSPAAFGGPGFDRSFGFDRSQSLTGRSSAGWPPPAPPRRRAGTGIILLVSLLGVLVLAGGGVLGWWLVARDDDPARAALPSPSSAAPSTASSDADARFVTVGKCVRNEGSEDVPQMTIVPCGEGAFEVLKRVDGATTGEHDAERKCAAVTGYTNWYFYDSELDALDFVLCLRGR